jgi:DNA invertase Pin-like site-specific DNA recombinase
LLDFGQAQKISLNPRLISLGFWTPMQVAIYARVSTHDQQTLPLQLKAMRDYAKKRGWKVTREIQEVGSGAKTRPKREELLKDARRRQVDAILVWRLDRWGRSVSDLIGTIRELSDTGVEFVSLNEAFDLTTPAGKALSGMLAVFAEFERDILRERVKAGIAHARSKGRSHGRPATASLRSDEIRRLKKKGLSNSEIARTLKISRASVIRSLQSPISS